MKLSNKTLIIFFGVILAYTLLAFAEIRFKGEHQSLNEENSIAEEVSMKNLKYVVISEDLDKRVTISSSNNPRIELKSTSGDILSKLAYEVKDDTLFLQKLNLGEEEQHFHFAVFIPTIGFEGVKATSSNVNFLDIKQASFSIVQSGGRVTFEDDIEIERLNITERDGATLNVYNSRIDTINVDLDDSDLSLRLQVNRLEGLLANKAAIYSEGANDVQLKKDKRSSIRIMD